GYQHPKPAGYLRNLRFRDVFLRGLLHSVVVGLLQESGLPGRPEMAKLTLLDPTRTGKQAQDLEGKLHRFVVGQDEAIREIVNTYQTYVSGLSPMGRPVGNFLFLGPTGSGKTRVVEALGQALLNNPRAVIKIDCGEFQHSHEIAKLIGSPPGYLGHRE